MDYEQRRQSEELLKKLRESMDKRNNIGMRQSTGLKITLAILAIIFGTAGTLFFCYFAALWTSAEWWQVLLASMFVVFLRELSKAALKLIED
jgi:hypothetical protein